MHQSTANPNTEAWWWSTRFPRLNQNLQGLVHQYFLLSQPHRITYIQNSVSGKAKDLIRGYSFNHADYNNALAKLESVFGSPQHIVPAYIHRLENWTHISTQNPHKPGSFFTSPKQLVQTFINLRFTPTFNRQKDSLLLRRNILTTSFSIGQNTLSRTTSTHQLCFTFSNDWRFKPELLRLLIRTLLDQLNRLFCTRDHRLFRKLLKRNKTCALSVNKTTKSLSVRSILILPSNIEYNKLTVCILYLCFTCLGQSYLKKKTAPRPIAVSNPTWVLCTTRPSTPLMPETVAFLIKTNQQLRNGRKPPQHHKCYPGFSPKRFWQQFSPTSVHSLTVHCYCPFWPRE